VKLSPSGASHPGRGPIMANNPSNKRTPLTAAEVQQAFEPLGNEYPPILNLQAAAKLSGYSPLTLKKKLSEGNFADCASRGKPLRFWRDSFVIELMNHRMPTQGKRQVKGGDREAN